MSRSKLKSQLYENLLLIINKLFKFRKLAPHALKGQKLLAQGNALGIMAIGNAPCKGKSFKTPGNI